MAKKTGSIMYKCSSCGYSQPRWLGRCPECGEWNSLEEIIIDKNAVSPAGRGSEKAEMAKPVSLESVEAAQSSRFSTKMLGYFTGRRTWHRKIYPAFTDSRFMRKIFRTGKQNPLRKRRRVCRPDKRPGKKTGTGLQKHQHFVYKPSGRQSERP